MDPEVLMALIGQCAATSTPPALVYAIAKVESGGPTFIVRDNTTGTVHRFHSYSSALSFVKIHARHSLDIGLMQINTKAHKVRPEEVLSPCENIREGSKILSRDMARSGQELRKSLCLYHRGKVNCRSYPEKVLAFLPSQMWRKRTKVGRMIAKRSSLFRHPSKKTPLEKEIPVFYLADTTQETEDGRGDTSGVLDSRFRSADVDAFEEK
jgi:hypothetical protein